MKEPRKTYFSMQAALFPMTEEEKMELFGTGFPRKRVRASAACGSASGAEDFLCAGIERPANPSLSLIASFSLSAGSPVIPSEPEAQGQPDQRMRTSPAFPADSVHIAVFSGWRDRNNRRTPVYFPGSRNHTQ